jgi:hypothetical protein
MHGHFEKAGLSGLSPSRGGLFRLAFWLFLAAFVPIVTAQAQTELGSEDDLTILGTDGTALDPDAEIKGFTVFGSTQAAYTGAVTGPGNVVVNGALAVSSGAYFVGNSTFTGAGKIFINDGTAGQLLGKNAAGSLQWLNGTALGDNLGSHVATTTLNMAGQSIVSAASGTFTQGVTASSFTALGAGFAGAQLRLNPAVAISSGSAARQGGVYTSTHIYTSANIYANNLYATKYYGDGSGLSGVSARNYLTVTLPTVLNEFMEIGNFDLASGAHNLYVAVTVSDAGFSVAKQYVLPIKFNLTGVTWYDAVPLSNTGAYSGNDFALEVKVTNTIAYLRLRRTAGASAGTAIVSIEQVGSTSDAFTPTGGSGSSASNNLLSVTPLTQAGGNVGVGTLTPGTKLEVAGDAMLSGSMRSLSFNGAQGLRDAGTQDLTLYTSDLTPGPVIISPANSEAARFTADMKLGLGTQAPAYRLVVSSGAGFAGTMMAISTGASNVIWMTGNGSVYANRYYGDGSNLTGIGGTLSGGETPKLSYWTGPNSLGNANITQDSGGLTVQASSFTVQGIGLSARQLRLAEANGVVISSEASPALGGGVRVSTNVYIVGFASATNIYAGNFYGNGSGLTGISGDDLGNHTATQNLNLAAKNIYGAAHLAASSATFAQSVTASSLTAVGIGLRANQLRLAAANGVVISSEASPSLGGGVRISTNVYIVGFASATNVYAGKFYGDGSSLTGMSGTLTGGETPKLPYWTGPNSLGNTNITQDAGGLTVQASSFTVQGALGAPQVRFADNVVASSATPAQYGGVYVSTHIYTPGNVYAGAYYGSAAGLTGLPGGDNLGSHIATMTVNMNGQSLVGASSATFAQAVTASSFTARGIGVQAAQVRFAAANGVVISSETSPALGGGVRVSTNVYIVGFASATKMYAGNYYGNGSTLTGLPGGDNLGSHIATMTVNMNGQSLVGASSATFAQAVTASSFTAKGIGVSAAQLRLAAANGVVISSEASPALGGGVRVSTNVYIVGFASATKMYAGNYYGNGSNLTGIGGTLSGGQTPRLPYWTGGNTLGNSNLSRDSATSLTAVSSTFTVQGGAFSVAGSTLTVKDGKVGIGLANPAARLDVYATNLTNYTGSVVNIAASTFDNLGSDPVLLNLLTPTAGTQRGKIFKAANSARSFELINSNTNFMLISDGGYSKFAPGGGGSGEFALSAIGLNSAGYFDGQTPLVGAAINLNVTGWGGSSPAIRDVYGSPVRIRALNPSGDSYAFYADVAEAGKNWAFYAAAGNSYVAGYTGLGTTSPGYRLVVSSGAGEAGNLVVISTGSSEVIRMTGAGQIYANKFIGDGSGLTGLSGLADDLGNHTAEQNLNMAGWDIVSVSTLTVSSITTTASAVVFSTNAAVLGNLGAGIVNTPYRLHVAGGDLRNENSLRTGNIADPGRWRFYDISGYLMSRWVPGTDFDTWGLYWDQPAKRMVWRGNGVDASWLDLDDGNGYYAGNLLVKSSVTIQGSASLPYAFQAGVNGVLISTGGAITTTGIGHGATAGNARGLGAVDLQTSRTVAAQVASGAYATIAGGKNNTASGGYATVSGGNTNAASAASASVLGGEANQATAIYSTIGGGYYNRANAQYSVVPGGIFNTARGDFSWAGGRKSSSTANGTFTWSDSQDQVVQNSVQDRALFNVRGGFLVTGSTNTNMGAAVNRGVFISGNGLVGISTGVPAAPLDVVSTGTASNIYAQIWRNSSGVAVASITSQGELYATLPVGAGNDNLGNHNAEQRLDMGNFPILKVSSLTITGNAAYAHALQAGVNGVLISTGGAITTTGTGNGTVVGNARGNGAVDLQTSRAMASQVASGAYSHIGGGYQNTASGIASIVVGGQLNTVSSNYNIVVGGDTNSAGPGQGALVVGGVQNQATGNFGVISGGSLNRANGVSASVPGGTSNTAKGDYSLAAGYFSSSTAQGSFTWSDSQGVRNDNTVTDGVHFKARGGFFVSGSTNTALGGTVNRGVLVTGNGLVGISTGTPQAALDAVATGTGDTVFTQIWRDSGGVIRASMTASGKLYADITAASGGGDNLGNHTATSDLIIGANAINGTGQLTMSSITASGTLGVSANKLWINPNVEISSTTAAYYGGVYISSHVYVKGMTKLSGVVDTDTQFLGQPNDTVAAPSFSWTGDPNMGIYKPGTDTLGFVTNGAEGMRITSTGNVGISTGNPQARLDVRSALSTPTDMTQIWRDSGGNIKSSMSATGVMMAVKFIGDGTGLSGVSASDNTKVLKAGDTMTGQLTLSGSSLTVTSALGIWAANHTFASKLEISSHTAAYGTGVSISTLTYTPGLVITSFGELQSVGAGRGGTVGLARGPGAVDLQVNRNAGSQVASGAYAVISGGDLNTAAGQDSTVSGGSQNTAGNQYAVVGGGIGNNASGLSSMIPGGNTNAASGAYALSAGYRANSAADGTFTWADSQGVSAVNDIQDRTVFKNRGGFLVTGSTSTSPSGTRNRAVFISGDGTVGISTGAPQAAIDMLATGTGDTNFAHIWRDSGGVIRASMTASGKLYANISGASGMLGDNLGNHTATNRLNMANKALDAVSSATISGTGVTGTNPVFKVVGSSFNILANGSVGVGVASPAYRFVVADGYKTAGLANVNNQLSMAGGGPSPSAGQIVWGDNTGWKLNLGTRSGAVFVPRLTIVDTGNIGISTQNPAGRLDILAVPGATAADMNTIWRNGLGVIVGSMSATGVMSATRFVGNGSGLTGVGDNLGNHTATANLNMGGFGIYTATSVYVHAGGLSTVAGSSRTMMGLTVNNSNSDNLLFISSRAYNGTDWGSAGLVIKRRVDVTDMGYMRFGSFASDPVSFGTQNTELMRIRNTGSVVMGPPTNTVEMDTSVAGKVVMKVNGVAVAEMLPN